MGSDARVSVGVAGATGYSGQELVRLLARHPRVALQATMASQNSTARSLPGVSGIWDGPIEPHDLGALPAARALADGPDGRDGERRSVGPEAPDAHALAIEFLAELGQDRWLHPLPGPNRRMPARHSDGLPSRTHPDRSS